METWRDTVTHTEEQKVAKDRYTDAETEHNAERPGKRQRRCTPRDGDGRAAHADTQSRVGNRRTREEEAAAGLRAQDHTVTHLL